MNIRNRTGKCFLQVKIRIIVDTGCQITVFSKPSCIPYHVPQDHLRVLHKIAVDRDFILCQSQMYPVRLCHNLSLPFLKE